MSDFAFIKTTCIIPEEYREIPYDKLMRQLNPNFKISELITPYQVLGFLHGWVRTTRDGNIKENFYIINKSLASEILASFKFAIEGLNPVVTAESIELTDEELIQKIRSNDTVYFREFSIFRSLFPGA